MSLTQLVDFFQEVNALKTTRRYSTCPETVRDTTAEHSWRLALMTIDVAYELKLPVDIRYSTRLALCHDLCEYNDDDDIDSYDVARGFMSKGDKTKAEEAAMRYLADFYGHPDIYQMWSEFEAGETSEARYVKALDKMETQLHLIDRDGLIDLGSAKHTVLYADKAVLAFPEVRPLLKEVKQRLKQEFVRKGFIWKPEYDAV